MNLNHLDETIAIVKAALHVRRDESLRKVNGWHINYLRGTKYWPSDAKSLNRARLLRDLAENPSVLRTIPGIGATTEQEIFRHLLATVGEA